MQSYPKETESQTINKLSIEALSLFLSGQQERLQIKLQQINQTNNLIMNLRGNQTLQSKKKDNKFQYELNFKSDQQQNEKKPVRKKPMPKVKAQRKSEYCLMCRQNQQLHLLSASNYVYLAFPKLKTFRKYQHLIIAPVEHIQTRIGADQGIVQEIKNYQKCLIQMFDKLGMHAIFLEQFSSSNSHIYIQCIGIPLKKAYDLPFFFKQALQNVEGFWTTHKKIIEIRKQRGGLQKQVPKQIKYFYIDFGLGYGYAHVIEDQKYWDRKFCYEIVAAALSMESYEVKTTEQYDNQELELKGKQFDKIWKKYDWTVLLQNEQGK